jgi:hypothetical protein
MNEDELREQLHAVLDAVTPAADLQDRVIARLGPSWRSMRRRTLLGVGSVVVVVALIVGLTLDVHSPHGQVRVVESPTTISVELAATRSIDPIEDFMNKHGRGADYIIAVEDSVAICMRSKGWVYLPRVADLKNVYGAGNGPTDPTALLRYRKSYGYGYLNPTPGDPGAASAIENANANYFRSLTPTAQVRYTSDLGAGPDERFDGQTSAPDSGCRGQAESAERKRIPRVSHAVERDLFKRWATVVTDPAYVAAQHDWASCMARAGFHFRLATDAQASISNLFAPPPTDPHSQASAQAQSNARALANAAALERRTGTADAECAISTVWPVQRRLGLAILQDLVNRYGRDAICGTSCP